MNLQSIQHHLRLALRFPLSDLHMHISLHIHLLLHLHLHLLLPLRHLRNRVHFLRILPDTFPQSLLRKYYIPRMRLLAFLNVVQHIVLNCILSLQLKNKTILQFECLFVQLVRHLELGVGLAHFLNHSLETLGRHHERLLDLVVLL